MNGHLPIAGFVKPHAAARRRLADVLCLLGGIAPAFRPTRKSQLLQQCARIGYTPHLRQSIKPTLPMIPGRRLLICLQRFPTT